MMNLLYKLVAYGISLLDSIFSRKAEISIGDILLKRGAIDYAQFTVSTRLLDIYNYEKGNDSFEYQNIVSRKLWGKHHKETEGNIKFKNLIESFRLRGFNPDSYFQTDKTVVLTNGTHRAALCLFHGIYKVKIVCLNRNVINYHTCSNLFFYGLHPEFIKKIEECFYAIQTKLVDTGNTFVAIMSRELYDVVRIEFSLLVNILKVSRFVQTNKLNVEQGICIQFSLTDPDYCIKNGEIISKTASQISDTYKHRYGDSIKISKSCLEGYTLYGQLQGIEELNI